MINALFQPNWAAINKPPRITVVTSTWVAPAPNTEWRITFRRAGDSSSPITNSSITTPISAASLMRSASCTTPAPSGPSTTPATR